MDFGDDKSWDDLYEIDAIVSYKKKGVFKAFFEVDCPKDSEGNFMKSFVFVPGIEFYVQNFTFYGRADIRQYNDKAENGWNEDKKTSFGFLIGAKMKL